MSEVTIHSIDFQKQLLKLICTNKQFSSSYLENLEASYFETQQHRMLFRLIADYVNLYQKEIDCTNLCIMATELCDHKSLNSEILKSLITEAKDIYRTHIPSEEFIITKVIEFVRNQEMKNAILKSIDIMEKGGNYEEIVHLINSAINIGDTQDTGMNFEDLFKIHELRRQRYSVDDLVTTGIPKMDWAMMGGMAKNELHVIQSAPKTGKSTFAVNVGTANIKRGLPIFHFSCELSDLDVLSKYACRLSGYSYDDLQSTTNIDDYIKKLELYRAFKPNLFVKYYPKNTVNCTQFRSYISKTVEKQKIKKVGLIIVDYDDCVNPIQGRSGDMYKDAEYVYTDLIQLGAYWECPVMTFAQPHRPAWHKYKLSGEFVTSDDLAHSAQKAYSCFSISSLNFKDKVENLGYLFVDLNRRGRSEVSVPIYRDFTKALFQQQEIPQDTQAGA